MTDPATVMNGLSGIVEDLANRQNDMETAAREATVSKRNYELELALTLAAVKGGSEADRKARALAILQRDKPGIYEDFKAAEGEWAAHQAVWRVLDRNSSILQSLLRAQTQESFRPADPQPAWSNAAA